MIFNVVGSTGRVRPWYANRRTIVYAAVSFFCERLVLFWDVEGAIWRWCLMAVGNCSYVRVLLPGATFFSDIFDEIAVFINQYLGLSSMAPVAFRNSRRRRISWLGFWCWFASRLSVFLPSSDESVSIQRVCEAATGTLCISAYLIVLTCLILATEPFRPATIPSPVQSFWPL